MSITKTMNKVNRKARQILKALKSYPAYKAEFGTVPAITMLRRNASFISVESYVETMSEYVKRETGAVTKQYQGGDPVL